MVGTRRTKKPVESESGSPKAIPEKVVVEHSPVAIRARGRKSIAPSKLPVVEEVAEVAVEEGPSTPVVPAIVATPAPVAVAPVTPVRTPARVTAESPAAGKLSSLRVMFVHGYESSSKSRKATLLRSSFRDFHCSDMELWNITTWANPLVKGMYFFVAIVIAALGFDIFVSF